MSSVVYWTREALTFGMYHICSWKFLMEAISKKLKIQVNYVRTGLQNIKSIKFVCLMFVFNLQQLGLINQVFVHAFLAPVYKQNRKLRM